MMIRANYGTYGSLAYYAVLAAIAWVSLVLVLFTEVQRVLFIATLSVSVSLLLLSVATLSYLGRKRMDTVSDIIAAANISASDRVLDVGTGRGFLAIEVAKRVPGSRVVGIDIWRDQAKGQMHKGFLIGNSKENAERNARLEAVSDRVQFRQCDAREMPFEPESFDVVVSYAALHQMTDFGAQNGGRVLEAIHRVLEPGGRLVAFEPLIGKRMRQMLEEVGFERIQLREVRKLGSLSLFFKILSTGKAQAPISFERLGPPTILANPLEP